MLKEEFYRIVDEVAKINEDEDIPISSPDDIPMEHEESTEPNDPREAVRLAIKKIDQAVSKGILHKNTAARKKARVIRIARGA